ncbi:MAG: hypothetical protein ACRBN8_25270 [Nannocystales bacterium]
MIARTSFASAARVGAGAGAATADDGPTRHGLGCLGRWGSGHRRHPRIGGCRCRWLLDRRLGLLRATHDRDIGALGGGGRVVLRNETQVATHHDKTGGCDRSPEPEARGRGFGEPAQPYRQARDHGPALRRGGPTRSRRGPQELALVASPEDLTVSSEAPTRGPATQKSACMHAEKT